MLYFTKRANENQFTDNKIYWDLCDYKTRKILGFYIHIVLIKLIVSTISAISNIHGKVSAISNIHGKVSAISNIDGKVSAISNIDGKVSAISNIDGAESATGNSTAKLLRCINGDPIYYNSSFSQKQLSTVFVFDDCYEKNLLFWQQYCRPYASRPRIISTKSNWRDHKK